MPGAVFVPAALNDLSVSVSLTSEARGDLFYRAAARWQNLPAGTSGQFLRTNGAGADPSWATITPGSATLAGDTDVSFTSVARGDVIYRGATVWNNLPAGTSGFVLTANGAGADPSWQAAGGSVAAAVILAPATGTRNDIQPTADVTPLRVLARVAGQTAVLTSWLDTAGAAQARITATGLFSSPHGTNGQRFGIGSSASANDGLAVGDTATANGTYCTAIGRSANASNTFDVAVGFQAAATGGQSLAFGGQAAASGFNSFAFGKAAVASGIAALAIGASAQATADMAVAIGASAAGVQNSVAIGQAAAQSGGYGVSIGASSSAAGFVGIALGYQANCAHQAITIGRLATSTADGQLVVGSSTNAYNAVYLGRGVTDASPPATAINATGGSGTNIVGGSLTLAGGKGTGSGAGGSVILSTAPAGSTGTTLGTLATRWTLDSTGLMTIADALNIAVGSTTGTKLGTVGGASGQKLGFFAAPPIVQPLLATGAGATVDNVISTLQSLGLCRQT